MGNVIDTLNDNQLVTHYLMSCYLYYELDKQVYTDDQFDQLAKRLLRQWDNVQHMHKHLITKGDLEAGTGYAIKYPERVKGGARAWYKLNKK